nr:hypothetical protein BaRGS_023275 [Batillaria attramentaria]
MGVANANQYRCATGVDVGIALRNGSGRGEKTSEKAKQFKPTPGPVKVYRDKKTQGEKRCVETQGTQTDDSLLEELIQKRLQQGEKRGHASLDREEEEAYELMVKETVPATYWQEIAEQRRLALNDTLEENKSLHKEMDSLREENEKLSELASQAAYLSSLLQDRNKADVYMLAVAGVCE